jgi:cbb3-type cytochrome oxidase subunit 3
MDFIIDNAATIATIFFFTTFCYAVFYAFSKKNKKKFEESAKIPLDGNR